MVSDPIITMISHRVPVVQWHPPSPKEGAALQYCFSSTGPAEGIPISGALWGTGIAPNWPSIQLVAVARQPQGALEPSNRVMAPLERDRAPQDREGQLPMVYLRKAVPAYRSRDDMAGISFFCAGTQGWKRRETETFCAHSRQ